MVWELIILLFYSQHCFVWRTHREQLKDVIARLEAARAFFGGVPHFLVIANFPDAVAGPGPLNLN